MPIKIPNALPAKGILEQENIFVMTELRAHTQRIRPLQIALLNLMPTKVQTETQIARLLGNTPLQVELDLVQVESHKAAHVSEQHMLSFYKKFSEISYKNYDGMIITGAPIEKMAFEDVDYWPELCEIMEWTKTHVYSTFHICWGAQAALYYHYGIPKYQLDEKLFGVFRHQVVYRNPILLRGFDEEFWVPHSRHTTVLLEDCKKVKELKILATSDKAGVYAMATEGGKQVFITGHSEYDRDTLKNEYLRDKNAGLPIRIPENYFPGDDDTKEPMILWRSHANLLYSNWLNYIVYQETPYDLSDISRV